MAIIETTYRSKPPLGSTIDWSHPLSKGLVGCWLMNEGGGNVVRDLARNNNGNLVVAKYSSYKKGSSIYFDGTANGYVRVPDNENFTFGLGDSFSVVSFFSPLNLSGNQNLVRQDNAAQSPRSIICLRNANTKAVFFTCGNVERLPIITGSTTMVNGNSYMAVGIRNAQLDVLQLFLNGKKDATDVTDTITETINSDSPFDIGMFAASTTERFNGHIYLTYFYRRALSPSEIQSLYESPYQFIKGPSTITYFTAPTGGWVWGGEVKNVMVA